MKQWDSLYFILIKDDGNTLELGTGKYKIVKNSATFNSLLTFENIEEERTIPIELYLNDINDIADFINFFEPTRYNEKCQYQMELYCNGTKYNASFTTDDKPFEVIGIEDLYGTASNPTATVKLNLVMDDPFFYSDYSYNAEIGAGSTPLMRFPLNFRLGSSRKFGVSQAKQLIPHIIDNIGDEENGVIITIFSGYTLVNPRIVNETTNFTMSINIEAATNDIIIINTIKKEVYKNGVFIANAKRLFDKWTTLIKGKNTLSFEADSGAELASVKVEFFNKFRAIDGGINK